MNRIRVTRSQVEQIAAANHVSARRLGALELVQLDDVTYFWTAA